jgi:hypothetical protein
MQNYGGIGRLLQRSGGKFGGDWSVLYYNSVGCSVARYSAKIPVISLKFKNA